MNNTPFVFKKVIVRLLLKKTFEDHSKQENKIKQSGLNWNIVRPGTSTNADFTEEYKHGNDYTDKSWKVKISRADVAHFLLDQLSDNNHYKMAVGISY